MSGLEIFKNDIKQYEKLKIISEITLVKEHIKLLEVKYGCGFKEIEKNISNEVEDFQKWDDYLELKGYKSSLKELTKKLKEIDHVENIKITE